jgi:hypothetical protein
MKWHENKCVNERHDTITEELFYVMKISTVQKITISERIWFPVTSYSTIYEAFVVSASRVHIKVAFLGLISHTMRSENHSSVEAGGWHEGVHSMAMHGSLFMHSPTSRIMYHTCLCRVISSSIRSRTISRVQKTTPPSPVESLRIPPRQQTLKLLRTNAFG